MAKTVLVRIVLSCLLLVLGYTSAAAQATVPEWRARIGSWNLLNFGSRKAGLGPVSNKLMLLQRLAQISQNHHIIFFQEILNTGISVTMGLQGQMPHGWTCNWVSLASGRAGRQERFSYCLSPTATYPGGPPVTVTGTYDYRAANITFTAVDGTQQNAQNVWMRPPSAITVSIPRPPPKAPVVIQIYDNHTKPSYGRMTRPRPPGTPANAAANSSVTNELTALQNNLRVAPGYLMLGDLNADCASYPQRYRGTNFPAAAGWTWWIDYGDKTNTAALSSCAYDRLIGDGTVANYYISHDIYTPGINVRLNGSRVSDHYKIRLVLGEDVPNKPKPKIVFTVKQTTGTKRKHSQGAVVSSAAKKAAVQINGSNLISALPVGTTANLYVVSYDSEIDYGGLVDIPLTDVRGSPTTITVASGGGFSSDVEWDDVPAGNYKLVLDVNKNGILNTFDDGDVINSADQIDMYVYPKEYHSQVVTIGDNGFLRELYSEGRAVNVYGLARGLSPNTNVTGYVISQALLPDGWTNWEALRAQGNLNLPSVAVPVKIQHGPIMLPSVTNDQKQLPLETDDTGHIFTAAWENPWVLFNMRALETVPPTPVYRPEYSYAEGGDDGEQDPCENAWKSDDANFQAVCNVGNQFSDHYGSAFNFVIDVNNNGVFDGPDLVDTYDIGDMKNYFDRAGNTVLGPNANGDPAVEEYKDFLDAKINLNPPLPQNATYGEATKRASLRYTCHELLSKSDFQTRLTPSSQIGFRLVDQDSYLQQKNFGSGLYVFDDVTFDSIGINEDSHVCIQNNSTTVNNLETGEKSISQIHSHTVVITGRVAVKHSSASCFVAAETATLLGGAGVVAVADPEPVSKVGFIIATGVFGLANLVAGGLCL